MQPISNFVQFRKKTRWKCNQSRTYWTKKRTSWKNNTSNNYEPSVNSCNYWRISQQKPEVSNCFCLSNFLTWHVTFSDFAGIAIFENFLEGSIHLLHVQSKQWKHQNNVPNMFKANNKKIKTTLITSFWCLYYQLWLFSTHCSGISTVEFKQVNVGWDVSWYPWQNVRTSNFWYISESLVVINK